MPDLHATEIVRDRLCSPSCLVAGGREAVTCSCPCTGRWHGALALALIPESAEHRRPTAPLQAGPHLLDELASLEGQPI